MTINNKLCEDAEYYVKISTRNIQGRFIIYCRPVYIQLCSIMCHATSFNLAKLILNNDECGQLAGCTSI